MNMRVKSFVLAVCAVLVVGIYWFYAQRARRLAQSFRPDSQVHEFVVGTNAGYPPFVMVDERGSLCGFDIDVATAIAERLGRPLVVHDMAFDALLMALSSGVIDAAIGGISLTPSRMQSGLFLSYYGGKSSQGALLCPAGNRLAHTLLWDGVAPVVIAVQAGSVFDDMVRRYPHITVHALADMSDVYMDVVHGSADGALVDCDTGSALCAGHPEIVMSALDLPDGCQLAGYGVGIAQKNKDLRALVAEVVEQLRADGTIERLATKWQAGVGV